MSIEAGTKLAHYEVFELIGRGGMGEVYRARDTKLERDVAIKVLPEAFAQSDERLRRFEREAKVLASLNHPNIAAIYGLERASDIHYLVLELVEGETLSERIARGPVPFEEAIEIAGKIGEALEEAHAGGVVHRDLKPANVKLTPDERVKVLDFGLAKAMTMSVEEEGADGSPGGANSLSPTITRDMTAVGVLLGTAAYMSPEQAKGKRVDKRADVWAFGALVYEMLTGRRAFDGDDVSDTLAAVLRAEPDFASLPANVSPAMRTALSLCLKKNPKERLRDIGDVQLAMEGALASGDVVPRRDARGHLVAYVVAALALAALTGVSLWALTRPPAPLKRVVRSVLTTPSSPPLRFVGDQHDLAVSPDGSRIVYRARRLDGRGGDLYERPLDELEGRLIEGIFPTSPFFSPDGTWVGFWSNGGLHKMRLDGGGAETIASGIDVLRGTSWQRDDTIVFADGAGKLYRVSAHGGEPQVILDPSPGDGDHWWLWWPDVLPGGKAILLTIFEASRTNSQIGVLELEDSTLKRLIPGVHPRFAKTKDGHIVYGGGDGTLRAVAFDAERLELRGDPITLVDDVMTKGSGATSFGLTDEGALVYVQGSNQFDRRLVFVDRSGRETAIGTGAMAFDHPRLSPDGRRVAVQAEVADNLDLYVIDIALGTTARLTRAALEDTSPLWSTDGTHIVFGSDRDGGGVYRIAADGAGEVERLGGTGEGSGLDRRNTYPLDWSHGGGKVVFYKSGGPNIGDIYALDVTTQQVEPLLDSSELQEAHPSLSPDGRWLAYTGNDTGRMEIYVRPYPGVDDSRVLISPSGGNEPLWSRDGREIFYWDDATRSMMAVPVTTEPTFRVTGVATRLFEGDYVFPQAGRHYDVSADGERFLMVKTVSDDAAGSQNQIVLVQNFFEELEARAPHR